MQLGLAARWRANSGHGRHGDPQSIFQRPAPTTACLGSVHTGRRESFSRPPCHAMWRALIPVQRRRHLHQSWWGGLPDSTARYAGSSDGHDGVIIRNCWLRGAHVGVVDDGRRPTRETSSPTSRVPLAGRYLLCRRKVVVPPTNSPDQAQKYFRAELDSIMNPTPCVPGLSPTRRVRRVCVHRRTTARHLLRSARANHVASACSRSGSRAGGRLNERHASSWTGRPLARVKPTTLVRGATR